VSGARSRSRPRPVPTPRWLASHRTPSSGTVTQSVAWRRRTSRSASRSIGCEPMSAPEGGPPPSGKLLDENAPPGIPGRGVYFWGSRIGASGLATSHVRPGADGAGRDRLNRGRCGTLSTRVSQESGSHGTLDIYEGSNRPCSCDLEHLRAPLGPDAITS
jgi:hypothetical protein